MSELKARKFFEAVPTSKEGFYQPGAFVDGYLKSEADKYIVDLEESHKMEVGQLLMEIVELKEQQRWHMFHAERPTKDMIGEEFIVSNGNYSKIAEWGEGYWENDPFCGSKVCDEVVKWKYLD